MIWSCRTANEYPIAEFLVRGEQFNGVNKLDLLLPTSQSYYKQYLAKADCKAGGGSFDFGVLKAKRQSFTDDVNEFLSNNTLLYSVHNLFVD
ncbi:unnamed protein product [Camellia sinensis]